MVPRDILAHTLSLLLLLGLTPIGHVLGAPSPAANAQEKRNGKAKRSPAVHFPLKSRDIGTLGENGRRIVTIEEVAEVRRRDLQRLKRLQKRDQDVEKRSGWETVGLSSYSGDAFYYISMQMGTPPQTIDVSVDTGSSDLWVQSSTCETCPVNIPEPALDGSKASFNYQASSSYHASSPQENVELDYADGSGIQGIVATDSVTVGGYTATDQTFILALAENTDFYTAGLMGLAWPSLAQSRGTPWWLNVVDQFEQPEFSFFLAEWDAPGTAVVAPGGQFSLGGRNQSLFDGSPTFIPLISQSFWTIPFEAIIVNNQTALTLTGNYASTIIDSGTTLIYGPDDVIDAFYGAIPGAVRGETVDISLEGQWLVPCSSVVNPQFKFTENATFTLPTTNLLWAQLSSSSTYCIASLMGTSTVASLSNAATTNPSNPQTTSLPDSGNIPQTPNWILGGAFMKSVYTVFRKGETGEQPSIGFAPIKGVNYNTDGLAIIGVNGDGVDGRIGEAGVTVIGTSQTGSSESVTTPRVNGATLSVQPNGQTTTIDTPSPTGGAIRMGLGNYLLAVVALAVMWGVNW